MRWLGRTLAGLTGAVEHAVFTEETARRRGWLQRVDPRAKLGMFLAAVLAAGLSASLPAELGLYAATLAAARASRVPLDLLVRRVWVGVPLFAGVVVLPSLLLGPPPFLLERHLGPLRLALSLPAAGAAAVFVARVGASVSLAVLLVLTTPWADLLKALRAVGAPQAFVLVLSMTYRYLFLLLHTVNGTFEARRSRTVGRTPGREHRRWIAGGVGALLGRSLQMSEDVHAAMVARGFAGEVRALTGFRMRTGDWAALAAAILLVAAFVAGRMLR